ncbi:MAG: hypothetical protein ACRC0G_10145, partial [Fusobacteriaceae bacterium]
MMQLVEPNLTKPNVGGDIGIWGDKLNTNIDLQNAYNKQVSVDSNNKNQELSRLERDKISKSELGSVVQVVVDNYVEANIKQDLGTYIEEKNNISFSENQDQAKGDIDSFVEQQKGEFGSIITEMKRELDRFTEQQKVELDSHEGLKEKEIDSYLDVAKESIGEHVALEKDDITAFSDEKAVELGELTAKKKTEITVHTDKEIERISASGGDGGVLLGKIDKLEETKANKSIEIMAGTGLKGGGDLSKKVILDIVTANDGIVINSDNIELNTVDDLFTGGRKRPLSAEQGRILNNKINAISNGGTMATTLMESERMSEFEYTGILNANSKTISVSRRIFNPTLYLNGVRIEKSSYHVDLTTGTITLNSIHSTDKSTTWIVEDCMDYHISFCTPTLFALTVDLEMLNKIVLGDVIKVLGKTSADDGWDYLVKCESTRGLNSVEIAPNKFLNEIPSPRMDDKLDRGGFVGTAKDLADRINGSGDDKLDRGGFVGTAKDLSDNLTSLIGGKLDKSGKASDSNMLNGQLASYYVKKDELGSMETFRVDSVVALATKTFPIGDVLDVQGYYKKGDGAHHKRKIEEIDDGSGIKIANGLWA